MTRQVIFSRGAAGSVPGAWRLTTATISKTPHRAQRIQAIGMLLSGTLNKVQSKVNKEGTRFVFSFAVCPLPVARLPVACLSATRPFIGLKPA